MNQPVHRFLFAAGTAALLLGVPLSGSATTITATEPLGAQSTNAPTTAPKEPVAETKMIPHPPKPPAKPKLN